MLHMGPLNPPSKYTNYLCRSQLAVRWQVIAGEEQFYTRWFSVLTHTAQRRPQRRARMTKWGDRTVWNTLAIICLCSFQGAILEGFTLSSEEKNQFLKKKNQCQFSSLRTCLWLTVYGTSAMEIMILSCRTSTVFDCRKCTGGLLRHLKAVRYKLAPIRVNFPNTLLVFFGMQSALLLSSCDIEHSVKSQASALKTLSNTFIYSISCAFFLNEVCSRICCVFFYFFFCLQSNEIKRCGTKLLWI